MDVAVWVAILLLHYRIFGVGVRATPHSTDFYTLFKLDCRYVHADSVHSLFVASTKRGLVSRVMSRVVSRMHAYNALSARCHPPVWAMFVHYHGPPATWPRVVWEGGSGSSFRQWGATSGLSNGHVLHPVCDSCWFIFIFYCICECWYILCYIL